MTSNKTSEKSNDKPKNNDIPYDASDYNVNNLIFEEAKEGTFILNTDKKTGKQTKTNFYRVPIKTKNTDGSQGRVFLSLGEDKTEDGKFGGLMCFGIKPFEDDKSGEITGYSCGLSLASKVPTEKQLKAVKTLESLTEVVKKFIVDNKNLFKKLDKKPFFPDSFSVDSLNDTNFVSYKTGEDGKREDNAIPSMFVKLIYYRPKKADKKSEDEGEPAEDEKKVGKIGSTYYQVDEFGDPVLDEMGEQITTPALELVDKWHLLKPVLLIDSIFISPKYQKIQVKIYDAEFCPIEFKAKRMVTKRLNKPQSNSDIVMASASTNNNLKNLLDTNEQQKEINNLTKNISSDLVLSDDDDDKKKKEDKKDKKKDKKKKKEEDD